MARLMCAGSGICFDYPLASNDGWSRRNRALAASAGEMMRARYDYRELEDLLSGAGFLVYEHLDADEATRQFFDSFNARGKGPRMVAPEGVAYCLAVREG